MVRLRKMKTVEDLTDEEEYDIEEGFVTDERFFQSISQIKCKTFRRKAYPFLKHNLNVVMCHYPIEVWPSKHYGWVHLHGHLHGRYDVINKEEKSLRVDVGLDGRLAGFRLISLEQIAEHFDKITGGVPYEEYVADMRKNKHLVM